MANPRYIVDAPLTVIHDRNGGSYTLLKGTGFEMLDWVPTQKSWRIQLTPPDRGFFLVSPESIETHCSPLPGAPSTEFTPKVTIWDHLMDKE